MGRWQEKVTDGLPATIEPKQKAFRPVEQIDLATGMQQIIAGTWEGIGLLETLDGHAHIFGRQVLIVADGIDRHRLKEQYSGIMIFTPAEFLTVVDDWPETKGAIMAKRIFNGEIIGGIENEQHGVNGTA